MTSYTKLIRKLYQERGIKALYRGYWATFWRDVPTFGAFFFVYDYLSRLFIRNTDSEAMKHFKLLWIGGLAGMVNWAPSYPCDLVKTIIQCDLEPKPFKIKDVIKMGYRKMGFKFFFTGISPTLVMAGPLHIIIMITY